MENLKYNPGKGYKMVKRGVNFGNALLTAAMAAQMSRRGKSGGRPKSVGPRLPGGAFRSKNAAKALARAALGQRRRKNKAPIVQVRPTPGLTSRSFFSLSHRPSPQVKALKRVGTPNYYITNGAKQYVATQGFQNAFALAWQSQFDIQAISLSIPTPTPAPGAYRTNRWVLESSQIEMLITNSSLASAYVELYDIVRKKDANQTEFPFTQSPDLAWQQGEFNAAQTNLTTDWQVINATPFDSQVFREFFKVVKRTRVELSQGATHRHAINLKPNRLIRAAMPEFTDGDYAGLTCYTMVVFKGQPASIPDLSGASPYVTTAQVALDIVTGRRYKYTWTQDVSETANIIDNLVTLKGEEVVSTGAGMIVPNDIV